MEENSVSSRAWYRTILMKGFHILVLILCTDKVKDTQCGFKLFTRNTATYLFNALHLKRWAFDIELIYLAELKSIPIVEVAVNWHEVDGSKLIITKFDIVKTSLLMARDMLCVRLSYLFGIWSNES
jgi:dolichyl-phosphate beta-glucosyltransferase